MVQTKRIYEPASKSDGYRILVDRLWPRGIKKETAAIDVWMKEVAPSNELRKWFNHEADKWTQFKTKYRAELKNTAALKELHAAVEKYKTVTLLYGAKDEMHNQAVALEEMLKG
ncbi:MAG: DUF488 domain-containing protein [Filimonas sp.]|nr:DUF488 domain-containing protein [Filimonas sp.]